MTEFQTATLAAQHAAIAAQHASIAAQNAAATQALWVGIGQIVVALAGVIVSAVLILRGFRLMQTSTEQRREEAQQQHAETMTALRALIERTAPKNGDEQ